MRDGAKLFVLGSLASIGLVWGLRAKPKTKDAVKGKKMETHKAQYRKPDGTLSDDSADAIRVRPSDIVAAASPLWGQRAPGFFAGVNARETNGAINEEDTDYRDDGSIKAKTYGPFQSDDPSDSITDPAQLVNPVSKFVTSMLKNLEAIAKAAKFDPAYPPRDAYPYLAWSHNNGLPEVLKSIAAFGMDWQKTINRNTKAYAAGDNDPDHGAGYMVRRMIPYGNAVLKYVDMYPSGANV